MQNNAKECQMISSEHPGYPGPTKVDLVSRCIHHASHTKCLSLEPHTSKFRLRNRLKNDLETSMKQDARFGLRWPKTSENYTKIIKVQAWTPRSPCLCCHAPLDSPMVPWVEKWRHQACQVLGTKHGSIAKWE